LCAAGTVAFLAAGCSLGTPELPDMPPFAGTEAFLEEQARVQRASETSEAFREKYNQSDPAALERRAHVFLLRQRELSERARQRELERERERERHERQRAEEGQRRFDELAAANRRREDRRRAREKAEEGKRRFAQIARANQNRQDLRQAQERAQEGKRRFAQAEFMSVYQKQEERKKAEERGQEGRAAFTEAQTGRGS
jgi:hypothetical protein